jgi:hypothetical protein
MPKNLNSYLINIVFSKDMVKYIALAVGRFLAANRNGKQNNIGIKGTTPADISLSSLSLVTT